MGSASSVLSAPARQTRDVLIARYMPSFTFMKPITLDAHIARTCMECLEKVSSGDYQRFKAKKVEDESVTPLTHFFGIFFELLFEADPSIEILFKNTNLKKQGKMLMQTFRFVAESHKLDQQKLRHALEMLANRHTNSYGVHPMYYAYFADSMNRTFRRLLGPEFSKEYEFAWLVSLSHVYSILIPAVVDATMSNTKVDGLQHPIRSQSSKCASARYKEYTASSSKSAWNVLSTGGFSSKKNVLREHHDLAIILRKEWDGLCKGIGCLEYGNIPKEHNANTSWKKSQAAKYEPNGDLCIKPEREARSTSSERSISTSLLIC